MLYAPGVMTDADWKACRVLTLQGPHNWGDASQIDRRVIRTLDDWAREVGKKILVTSGTGGTHVSGSFHYASSSRPGLALDFMLHDTKRSELPDLLYSLLRREFNGVGIYSGWRFAAGLPEVGGFHVDCRPGFRKALWLCHTKGRYEEITLGNVNRYFT